MLQSSLIDAAIRAGILSNQNPLAFDFAGNYRLGEVKDGEIIFEHIADRRLLHWVF
jgi:hypothetical protein